MSSFYGVTEKICGLLWGADHFKQALDRPVTINAAQSPDAEWLTVQFAAMEICKAAGNVPYQFEKSQQLAGQYARGFIEPFQANGIPASQALSSLLAPLNLRYEVDDKGVYLTK